MLAEVEEANNLRTHFNANISENMANVKAFVVRAEASLMIGDIDTMKHMYALVQRENDALIAEYIKRSNNHKTLVTNLKEANVMIRKAANLRIGQASKDVISASREAIRSTNHSIIPTIFERGSAVS